VLMTSQSAAANKNESSGEGIARAWKHNSAGYRLSPHHIRLFFLAHASCLNQTKRIETGTTP